MEKSKHNLISLQSLNCLSKKHSIFICTSENCKHTAFMCSDEQCDCIQSKHYGCSSHGTKYIVNSIEKQRKDIAQGNKNAFEAVLNIYEEMIERISKEKEEFIEFTEVFGLEENTIKFVNLIRDGKQEEVDGDLAHKVYTEIKKQGQKMRRLQLDESSVEKMWQKKKKIFDNILKEFGEFKDQDKVEQNLKLMEKNRYTEKPIWQNEAQTKNTIQKEDQTGHILKNKKYRRYANGRYQDYDQRPRRAQLTNQQDRTRKENNRNYQGQQDRPRRAQPRNQQDRRPRKENNRNYQGQQDRPRRAQPINQQDRRPRRRQEGIQRRHKLKLCKIKQIGPGDEKITFIAKVLSVQTDGEMKRCLLGDETAVVRAFLPNSQHLQIDNSIVIINAVSNVVEEHIEIQIRNERKIGKAKQPIESIINQQNNISDKFWVVVDD